MAEPVITAIRSVASEPNERGSRVIARFSCSVRGIHLREVKLVRDAAGAVFMRDPLGGGGHNANSRGATVEDRELRAAIIAAAEAALAALPART